MDKQTKPDISIPESFANNGTKTDFSETKIENGFERFTPEILAGDNLNKFIDDTYKGLNYSIKTSDAVNLINDEEILTVHDNFFRTLPLQNPLAYSTGKISEDKILFNEVKKRKRSTFDLSKFEVVGNPVITDDGVASEFALNSYITFQDLNLENANTWEIEGVVKTVASGTTDGTWLSVASGNGIMLPCAISEAGGDVEYQLYLSSTSSSWDISANRDITFPSGHTVKCNLKFTGTQYIYTCTDLDTNTVKTVTINSTAKIYQSPTRLGVKRNITYYQGSIDLKNFSITVDGKEIFSGNKTGLDVIKPDNYTVVGSSVISDVGVASGFSSQPNNINYLTIPTIQLGQVDNWKIHISFNTSDLFNLPTEWIFVTSYTNFFGGISLGIEGGANLRIRLASTVSSTSDLVDKSFIKIIKPNTKYEVIVEFTGTTYNISYKIDNNEWVIYTTQSTTKLYNDLNFSRLGYRSNSSVEEGFSGSIDLNAFKIYVDGNLVYQPCLKIPYTLSKTGSKIVDVAYRDRVIDLYEQEGQAGYYTIDEENQNFTLPMGEIYGMIEQKGTYQPPLLSTMWSDHLLNDVSWLRADTFSWQDGTTYSQAYNELLSEYNDSASVEETEGSITFKRTPKGYKIALATQETSIAEKYTTDGIAWYYILDTTNKKFKLPRTKFGFEGLRTSVADDIEAGLPNITGSAGMGESTSATGAFQYEGGSASTGNTGTGGSSDSGFSFDASLSNPIYDNSDTVQPPATQMYLYFYVGAFTKSAEAQTAGLKAELLNGKADVTTPSIQAPYLKTTYLNGASGYNIWSNGYCEQWGSSTATGHRTITFAKTFKDEYYNITCTTNDAGTSYAFFDSMQSKASEAYIKVSDTSRKITVIWQACGYLAEGEY